MGTARLDVKKLRRPTWRSDRPPRVAEIIGDVCLAHSVRPFDVLSNSHEAKLVEARRQIILELRERGFSTTTIGRYLGGRHHTTIIHHLKLLGLSPTPRPAQHDQQQPPPAQFVPDESGIWAI